MRKLLLVAATFLALVPLSRAQDKLWEVSAEVGIVPFMFLINDLGTYSDNSTNTLAGQYSPRYKTSSESPMFEIRAARRLSGPYSIGIDFGGATMKAFYEDPMTDDEFTVSGVGLSLLAYGKMEYYQGKKGVVYGSLGAGASALIRSEGSKKTRIVPAFEVVPVGISFGKTVGFNIEMVLGSSVMGYRAGISYKF